MVSSEAVPLAKTGGLADVVGTLPGALKAVGDEAAVVLPRYRSIPLDDATLVWEDYKVWFHGTYHRVDFWEKVIRGVRYFLADCPPLFDRNGIYGDANGEFGDNAVRYAVLSHAALGVARHLFPTDIFHCHDWQAGLVPLYLKFLFAGDPTFFGAKTLFTIHNIGYQGYFPKSELWWIGLDDRFWNEGALEHHGGGSLMKAGIVWSDEISTVSPTHAREIQTPEYGFGMEGVLAANAGHLIGILNGCDYAEWNPETDRHIAAHFSADDLEGKWECKKDLLLSFGLPADEIHMSRPLIGMVTRLAHQKGLELLAQVMPGLVDQDMTLIVLGSGEQKYEDMLNHFSAVRHDKVRVWIGHNNVLAHKIEAGADMFLMPSRYEPCGLNQMYSLRYGTLPIVRATGGLEDSVDGETGFKFWRFEGHDFWIAIQYALATYRDHPRWVEMMKTAMRRDFSWTKSAAQYSALYSELRKRA